MTDMNKANQTLISELKFTFQYKKNPLKEKLLAIWCFLNFKEKKLIRKKMNNNAKN
jgi:hypothetical protein